MIDTQELLALHVSVFRREEIKPPTPVPLTIHFSAALKALVLGHFFRLHITFAREVCQLFFSLSPIANCLCECDSKSTTSLKNYLIQGFSLQLKIDRLKYWNWLLCGSSRREPSVLKTGRRLCRCYILLCWDFFLKEKGKYIVTLVNRSSLILPRIQHKVAFLVLRTVFA